MSKQDDAKLSRRVLELMDEIAASTAAVLSYRGSSPLVVDEASLEDFVRQRAAGWRCSFNDELGLSGWWQRGNIDVTLRLSEDSLKITAFVHLGSNKESRFVARKHIERLCEELEMPFDRQQVSGG